MFKQYIHTSGNELTHVLMDGGKLHVPFDKIDDFYLSYINFVKQSIKVFVVEQKTMYYNFFMDIDYIADEPLSMERVYNVTECICKFVNHDMSLVSVSEPKHKNGKIKTGIHINWNGLVVDQSKAIELMNRIVTHLYTFDSSVEWRTCIDPCVYGNPETGSKGSGFRLPWSHKKTNHEACHGKGCVQCEHTGKITEGVYLPIIHNYEYISPDITLEKLKLATVRTSAPYTVPIPPPVFKNVPTEVELQEFIQRNMEGQSKARILKVLQTNKRCMVVSTDSKYCANKKTTHKSNHVWFEINNKEKTICQKCHDDECKKFSGRKHRLPDKICEIMFGSICKVVLNNVYLHTVPDSRIPSCIRNIITNESRIQRYDTKFPAQI